MRPILILAAAALTAGAGLAVAAPAPGVEIHYSGRLTGAAETPPNDSKATGEAKVNLEPAKHWISWTVSYSGLSGPAMAAHFHGPAKAGEAAGVELPITGAMTSPLKGATTISDAQMKDLEAGLWYVNIHTEKHPGGEIRAQLARGR